jgi:type I restriction enzyme S subunit
MAKLGEVCKLNMGQSPDSSSYNDTGDGIPFFQGNADFGEVHPNIRVWCNAPTKIAHPGEILISVRAPIGAMNIADCECCIGRGLASISVDESICTTKYLWYDLFSKIEELNSKGTGSTFKAINKKTLEETEVQLRDMDEQRKISETLDKITQLVSLRKQQLAKLDELVKARFVEIFGDPVYNEMHWETKRLIDICRTIVDCPHSTPHYTTKDTGYKCIRTSAVKKNKILWEKVECISKQEYEERIKRKRPEKGDVIYTREGAILGIAAVIDRDYNVALGQRSMLLSPDIYKCTPCFLSMAMNFDSFLGKALGEVSGSASPHINVGDIKALEIIAPPIEIQNQFSTFVEQVDQQKQAVQQSLEKLELMKKALMQEYFG